MSVHLLLDGTWANCTFKAAECWELIHRDDLTLTKAQAIPQVMMQQLLTVLHPPDPAHEQEHTGVSVWLDADRQLHRDYDLPAVTDVYGYQGWYRHGELYRAHGKPNRIQADGKREWWVNGQLAKSD